MIYERCLNPACQRLLSDPASRRRGFGRKCWEDRLAAARVPVAAVNRRWDAAMTGQEELEVTP